MAAVKVREKYSSVENPERAAISFMGRDVAERSRRAVSMRVAAISPWTVDENRVRNVRSTKVRENPTWRNTSAAEMPLAAFAWMKAIASVNQGGALG